MPKSVAPMLHVPDVAATAAWYTSIGFEVIDLGEDDGETTFAMLSFGDSAIMLNCGGKPSDAERREVDLYVTVDDAEEVFAKLAGKGELVEGLHDTFYGAREFTIRDCNRFWITFGQPLPAEAA